MIPLPGLLTGLVSPAAGKTFVIVQASGEDVAMMAIFMGTLSGVFYPLVRAWARRLESKNATAVPLAAVEERLDRIERSVESIAVEVERVSEGQRFVTKLLAERSSDTRPRLES